MPKRKNVNNSRNTRNTKKQKIESSSSSSSSSESESESESETLSDESSECECSCKECGTCNIFCTCKCDNCKYSCVSKNELEQLKKEQEEYDEFIRNYPYINNINNINNLVDDDEEPIDDDEEPIDDDEETIKEMTDEEIQQELKNILDQLFSTLINPDQHNYDENCPDCNPGNSGNMIRIPIPPPPGKPVVRITVKDFMLNFESITKDTPSGQKIVSLNGLADLIKLLDHEKAPERQKELLNILKELENLIGLKLLKDQLVNQVLFFLLDLFDPGEEMFLHTVITGNPGCGKTTVANIIAKIYKALGFLSNDKIIKADRASLIAGYLGQTAIKTKKVLESAKGGVLFIDEAYSLGSSDREDSFAKECVDTINQYLSEHANDFICIIAGYERSIEDCFFRQNDGLKRRFPWKFNVEDYNETELYEIFTRQCGKWTLNVDKDFIVSEILKNIKLFSNNGGDTKTLLEKCRVAYSRRIICMPPGSNNKEITKEDFVEGFKHFLIIKSKKKDNNESVSHSMMYV